MRRRVALGVLCASATAILLVVPAHDRLLARQSTAAPAGPGPVEGSGPSQAPAPVEGAAQAEAERTTLAFASDAGLILSPIKPDRTAAFEEVIAKVQEALARSADPVRKQQAAAWKIYRAEEPYQNTTLYVSLVEPPVKGADYGLFRLLQESLGDAPARELFEKFRDAHAGGHHILHLTRVGPPGTP
jgi:hypothetical protein